jgi:hypothetical protein
VVEKLDDLPAASKFGGRPLAPPGYEWPACGNCGRPMALFVQVSSRDLPAEAGQPFGEGTLQLFYCLSGEPHCEVDAEAFFPFSRATLARVLPPAAEAAGSPAHGEPGFYTGRIVSWRQAEDYPHREDQQARGIVLSDVEADGVGDVYPRSGDKLLGWPHWIQGLEYPDCPDCGQRMDYVFQVDSEDNVPHMFGDVGCGHVFRCARHPEHLTFGWACS